jgi:hypothetical protein
VQVLRQGVNFPFQRFGESLATEAVAEMFGEPIGDLRDRGRIMPARQDGRQGIEQKWGCNWDSRRFSSLVRSADSASATRNSADFARAA